MSVSFHFLQVPTRSVAETVVDPWTPLDPHQVKKQDERPFRKGVHSCTHVCCVLYLLMYTYVVLCTVPSHVHMYTHVHCVVLFRKWVCPVMSWFDIVYPRTYIARQQVSYSQSVLKVKEAKISRPASTTRPTSLHTVGPVVQTTSGSKSPGALITSTQRLPVLSDHSPK